MSMVSFKRGPNLNNLAIADGQFIVNTEERSIYVDVGDKRLRIGDFVSVATVNDLPAAGANTTALYYVEDINCLAKWDGAAWVQINRDTGVKEVKVEGEGNAITAAAYDATSRVLTLTKGETFATPTVVDTKIANKVGDLGDSATVKAYVDAKTAGIASEDALTQLGTRVDAAESDIDGLQAAIGADGSVTKAIADAKKAGTDAADAAATAQATAESKTTMAEVEAKDYATKTEAQGYANAKDASIAAAKAAADTAQSGVNAVNEKIGTVTEGKTVVEMINDAKTAATYDDTEVKNSIKANSDAIGVISGDYLKSADKTELQGNIDAVSGKVTTLIGSVEGDDAKSVRTISAEEVTKIVNGAPESMDTLKEISDWISGHKDDASAMNSAILDLEAILAGFGTAEGETATVKKYVDDAVTALKIGDYAKAADLTALAARVTTVEGQIATLNGDENTAGSVKKALADAKAYTDGKDSAMDTRVKALESDTHTHANKAELDKIEAGDKAKWDAAEQNAKTYADGLASNYDAKGAAATAEQNAKDYADGLAKNYDASGSAATALTEAKAYADGLAENYDAAGAATTAETNAKSYTESLLTWGEF